MELVIKEYYTANIEYTRYLNKRETPTIYDRNHNGENPIRYESACIIISNNDVMTACETFNDMFPYLHEGVNLVAITSVKLNSSSPALLFKHD